MYLTKTNLDLLEQRWQQRVWNGRKEIRWKDMVLSGSLHLTFIQSSCTSMSTIRAPTAFHCMSLMLPEHQ